MWIETDADVSGLSRYLALLGLISVTFGVAHVLAPSLLLVPK